MTASPENFCSVRRLQIKTLHQVENFFAGIYRSSFKGQGLEFENVRPYQEGDDLRTIDWNVTARSQSLYVKSFKEERELTVLLLVDVSASGYYGHDKYLKIDKIAELGALLAFSVIHNQDKIGLILFSNEIELYLRPQKNVSHVLRVIRELLYFKPKYLGTDVKKALKFAGKVQKKRAICFMISDFYAADFSLQASLIAKHHELIAIQVQDTYEQYFPSLGLLTLQDLESNQLKVISTSDLLTQKNYQEDHQKHQKTIKQLFEKIGVNLIKMTTKDSSAKMLYRFFQLRKRKR